MNTKIIIIDGEQITVTQHSFDDYDIYFHSDDYSVRGSSFDVFETFADWIASKHTDDRKEART